MVKFFDYSYVGSDGYEYNRNRMYRNGSKSINHSNEGIRGLLIPEGVRRVMCYGNDIRELVIPPSLVHLECDKGVELKGDLSNLEKLILW